MVAAPWEENRELGRRGSWEKNNDRHPTGWTTRAPSVVGFGVKVLVGLVAFATLVSGAFWLASNVPETVQVETGAIGVPENVYDPVRAGEPTPAGFRQLLSRDAILPIYSPTFVPSNETDWSDDTLVIGIELDGESKAYPVSFLNRREMVIDWIGGTPVLVSW